MLKTRKNIEIILSAVAALVGKDYNYGLLNIFSLETLADMPGETCIHGITLLHGPTILVTCLDNRHASSMF